MPYPAMRSIVVERMRPHPPEKIGRTLTEGPPIERWLSSRGEEAADGLDTAASRTPSPDDIGTLVRKDHPGFRPEDEGFYQGAGSGLRKFASGPERGAAGRD